jgi:hypothetical protein
MSKISKIMKTIIGIFVLLLIANTSSAGVELTVTPENGVITAAPGGTINYIATVTADPTTDDFPEPQDEVFSIDDADKQPGWDYIFDPGTLRLEAPGESKSTILTINIASDAPPGIYHHTVIVDGYDEFGTLYGVRTETDIYVINTDVSSIPEFPAIVFPIISVLGLLFVMRKSK